MTTRKKALLAVLFGLVIACPAVYFQSPMHLVSPDLQFVKAKVMWVALGDLYGDPVTGFPTFHPPLYHLILSLPVRLGIDLEPVLIFVTILNLCLTCLFGFLALRERFPEKTALLTVLLLPFINQFMGPGYLLLATAFYFSIPFYLAGLWLYLKPPGSALRNVIIGILWGLAFQISPGYFFLIGLTFAYELFIRRHRRRFLILVGAFLVTIIPYIHQAYTILGSNLGGTDAFSLWRGIPDAGWLSDFARRLVSPTDANPFQWQVPVAVALAVIGLIGWWHSRKTGQMVVLMIAAYLLTAYSFNMQYASRLQLFLSLFLAAGAIDFLLTRKTARIPISIVLTALVVYASAFHLEGTVRAYKNRVVYYDHFREVTDELKRDLEGYFTPGEYILASDVFYRTFLMPFFPVHGLVAYRSGEYFQLNSRLSDDMRRDYDEVMASRDTETIEYFCRKYRIQKAVIGAKDADLAALHTIFETWTRDRIGRHFKVLVSPDQVPDKNNPTGFGK